jgi:hypothetical protein
MNGNEPKVLVVQGRDLRLFRELAVLRVLDRELAKVVAGFTSTTRANARLLALVLAGLLRRFFLGTPAGGRKALYALSQKGAALAGVPFRGLRRPNNEILSADFFVEHQLAINRLYCSLKFGHIPVAGVSFVSWKTFEKPLTPELRLIPDGYVELSAPEGPLRAYIEVDLGHESRKVWKQKVDAYVELALLEDQRPSRTSGFRVLIIANSERRDRSIRSVVAPLTAKLFWFASIPEIEQKGIFGPVWLRPRSDMKERLVHTP